MFDIDHILGNKKSVKAKKQIDLFGFNTRIFSVGDKVTKPQKKILVSNNWMKMWSDSDKDGVINGLDCQPKNKHKHNAMFRQHIQEKYKIKLPNEQDRYMTNKYVHAFQRNPEVLSRAKGVTFQGRDEWTNSKFAKTAVKQSKDIATNQYGVSLGQYAAEPNTLVLSKPVTYKFKVESEQANPAKTAEEELKRAETNKNILESDENETLYHEIRHASERFKLRDYTRRRSEAMKDINYDKPYDETSPEYKQCSLRAERQAPEWRYILPHGHGNRKVVMVKN